MPLKAGFAHAFMIPFTELGMPHNLPETHLLNKQGTLLPHFRMPPLTQTYFGCSRKEGKLLLRWSFTSGGMGLDEDIHPRTRG